MLRIILFCYCYYHYFNYYHGSIFWSCHFEIGKGGYLWTKTNRMEFYLLGQQHRNWTKRQQQKKRNTKRYGKIIEKSVCHRLIWTLEGFHFPLERLASLFINDELDRWRNSWRKSTSFELGGSMRRRLTGYSLGWKKTYPSYDRLSQHLS